MSEETPKFCTEENSFSLFITLSSKNNCSKNSLLSLIQLENNKQKHRNKSKASKKKKGHEAKNKRHKRHNSELKIRKYNIHNINEFMKKHKFKIRNDFDKKNSEIFLLSKEKAFENPLIYYN